MELVCSNSICDLLRSIEKKPKGIIGSTPLWHPPRQPPFPHFKKAAKVQTPCKKVFCTKTQPVFVSGDTYFAWPTTLCVQWQEEKTQNQRRLYFSEYFLVRKRNEKILFYCHFILSFMNNNKTKKLHFISTYFILSDLQKILLFILF